MPSDTLYFTVTAPSTVVNVDSLTSNPINGSQDLYLMDGGDISDLEIKKMGKGDGAADTFNFDLSAFDDDFTVNIVSEGSEDSFIIDNASSFSVNSSGVYTILYIGSDGNSHEVTIDPENASVIVNLAGDDIVSGTSGDDVIDQFYLGDPHGDVVDGADGIDDVIDALGGNDSISAGAGQDTVYGGSGADTIYGQGGNDLIYGDKTLDPQYTSEAFSVSNSSFENATLSDGAHTLSDGAHTSGSISGWTLSPGASAGVYNPKSWFDESTITGQNVAWLYDDGDGISQTTAEVFQDGKTYQFQMDIGDSYQQSANFTVNIYAGATLIGTVSGNAGDEDRLDSLTVSSDGYSDPSLNGSPIRIEIVKDSGGELLVDNVTAAVLTPIADDDYPGGNDIIYGGVGDDTIFSGAGNDTIYGGADADALDGGSGDDALGGGEGNDTLSGQLGDDLLTGGGGDDVFIYAPGDGNDTITDFNFGNTGALGDGDITNNDFIDLGAYYDSMDELRADFADDGILNQSNALDDEGNATDYSDNTQFSGGSVTMQGATPASFTADNTGVVCFTSGTAIMTPTGEVLIDELRPGDMVNTLDNGPQPIAWIGRRDVTKMELAAQETLRPIMIKKSVLGAKRDIFVSRQHGMLINGDNFARAIHLADYLPGVRIAHGKKKVTYIHLMFDAHQIIFAEGMPSESFFPGPQALAMMASHEFKKLVSSFPQLENIETLEAATECYGALARPFLKRKEVEKACKKLKVTQNDKRPAVEKKVGTYPKRVSHSRNTHSDPQPQYA
jgi:Ca2+-binding RTX toxin-like protein